MKKSSNLYITIFILIFISMIIFLALYNFFINSTEKKINTVEKKSSILINTNKKIYLYYENSPNDFLENIKKVKISSLSSLPDVAIFMEPIKSDYSYNNLFIFKETENRYQIFIPKEIYSQINVDNFDNKYYNDEGYLFIVKDFKNSNDFVYINISYPNIYSFICLGIENNEQYYFNRQIVKRDEKEVCLKADKPNDYFDFKIYSSNQGEKIIKIKYIKIFFLPVLEPLTGNPLSDFMKPYQEMVIIDNLDNSFKYGRFITNTNLGKNFFGLNSKIFFKDYSSPNFIALKTNFPIYFLDASNKKLISKGSSNVIVDGNPLTPINNIGDLYIYSLNGKNQYNVAINGGKYFSISSFIDKKSELDDTIITYTYNLEDSSNNFCYWIDPDFSFRDDFERVYYYAIKTNKPNINICKNFVAFAYDNFDTPYEVLAKYVEEGGNVIIFYYPKDYDIISHFGDERIVSLLPIRNIKSITEKEDIINIPLISVNDVIKYKILEPDTYSKCIANSLYDCVGFQKDNIIVFSFNPKKIIEKIKPLLTSDIKYNFYIFRYTVPSINNNILFVDVKNKYGNKITNIYFDNNNYYINNKEIIRLNFNNEKIENNLRIKSGLYLTPQNSFFRLEGIGGIPLLSTTYFLEYGSEKKGLKIKEEFIPTSSSTLLLKFNIDVLEDINVDYVNLIIRLPFNIQNIDYFNGKTNELIIKTNNDPYGMIIFKDPVFDKIDVSFSGNTINIKILENKKVNQGKYHIYIYIKRFYNVDFSNINLYFFSFENERIAKYKINGYITSNEGFEENDVIRKINEIVKNGGDVILIYDLSYLNILNKLGIKYKIKKYKESFYFDILNYYSVFYEKDNNKLSFIIKKEKGNIILIPKFLLTDENFLEKFKKFLEK